MLAANQSGEAMPYNKIDLVGGEHHGRVCDSWAGEGVFPVWPEPETAALGIADMDGPQTVVTRRPVNYSVRYVRVNGLLFTYAAPCDMSDEAAFRCIFPHAQVKP